MAVSIVNKKSADGSWSGVQIFVAAPGCSINIPVMKLKRHISDGMCKVPYNEDTSLSSRFCDSWYVEILSGVKLDSRE